MSAPKNTAVLLINLDKSVDRLQKSEQLLKQYDVPFHRISAIDGRQIPSTELEQILAPDYSGYYKVLSAAEIGCYLSHRKCWQYVLDQKLDYAVILEDDFNLMDDLSKVHEYIKQITIPWDQIKLIEYPLKRKVIKRFTCLDRELVVYDKIPNRSCAYVVSKSGAQKLLNKQSKIARPVDIDFQYWWECGLLVFGLKPYLVSVNNELESTIDAEGSRRSSAKSVLKQYLHKIQFYIKNKKLTKKRLQELK